MRLRFAIALGAVLVVGVAAAFARPWHHEARGGAVVAQSSLRAGGFAIVVRNDSGETLRIAQVTVNDAFVAFHARRLLLAPHQRTRLTIDYGWVKGEPYEIGILTSSGAIIESEVDGAESS